MTDNTHAIRPPTLLAATLTLLSPWLVWWAMGEPASYAVAQMALVALSGGVGYAWYRIGRRRRRRVSEDEATEQREQTAASVDDFRERLNEILTTYQENFTAVRQPIFVSTLKTCPKINSIDFKKSPSGTTSRQFYTF